MKYWQTLMLEIDKLQNQLDAKRTELKRLQTYCTHSSDKVNDNGFEICIKCGSIIAKESK